MTLKVLLNGRWIDAIIEMVTQEAALDIKCQDANDFLFDWAMMSVSDQPKSEYSRDLEFCMSMGGKHFFGNLSGCFPKYINMDGNHVLKWDRMLYKKAAERRDDLITAILYSSS
jgi:hypothetical protein